MKEGRWGNEKDSNVCVISEEIAQINNLSVGDKIQFNDYKEGAEQKMVIELTRKELSNMTGLRIETIIRTIKKMEKDGKLKIVNGKVFY